jgi:hypothetical protein
MSAIPEIVAVIEKKIKGKLISFSKFIVIYDTACATGRRMGK